MFYIVESESQVRKVKQIVKSDCFLEVITNNDNFHPKLAYPIAIYIRVLEQEQGFILPIDHPEAINLDKNTIQEILNNCNRVFTRDKKRLLYFYNLKDVIDINLLYSMTKYDRLETDSQTSISSFFYNRESDNKIVNKLIPLSKLYESYENIFEKCKTTVDIKLPQGFTFYNDLATKVFYLIEQSGLGIHYKAFNKLFTPKNPLFNIEDNVVYTYFNLYNPTSRPTNSFNSVNFSALPKQEEYRKCFYPKNDYFVEFDFDGYHLRLLAELLEYPLTQESAHKQLAKLYFGKEEVTEEEYAEAKQINFQAIYGKIPDQVKDFEFFKKIKNFIDKLWDEYTSNGVIYNPDSNKPFTKELKNMNPSKLMNYFVQSLESSKNILILKEVLKYLRDRKSSIVLYTYDSIVIDFHKEDKKDTLLDLKKILEQKNKYPVKFNYSNSLVL